MSTQVSEPRKRYKKDQKRPASKPIVDKTDIRVFQSKYNLMPGTNIKEVRKNFERIHNVKYHKNKRRLAYILSKYYNGEKIFTADYFTHSGKERRRADAIRRLKLFEAGADLLENGTNPPVAIIENRHGKGCRFIGRTKSGVGFYVQIQVKKDGSKYLMSTFPQN